MNIQRIAMALAFRMTLLVGAVALAVWGIRSERPLNYILLISAAIVFASYVYVYFRTRRIMPRRSVPESGHDHNESE